MYVDSGVGCVYQCSQEKEAYLLRWWRRGRISAGWACDSLHHMNRMRSRGAKLSTRQIRTTIPSREPMRDARVSVTTIATLDVTHDWILYVDNASSSFKTLPIAYQPTFSVNIIRRRTSTRRDSKRDGRTAVDQSLSICLNVRPLSNRLLQITNCLVKCDSDGELELRGALDID
jgi:hypothetical protein